MPIFEYVCGKCSHQFEQLVLSSREPDPDCPECHSRDVQKLMSAGAIRSHGIPTGSGGFKAPSCVPSG